MVVFLSIVLIGICMVLGFGVVWGLGTDKVYVRSKMAELQALATRVLDMKDAAQAKRVLADMEAMMAASPNPAPIGFQVSYHQIKKLAAHAR
ncbi:MAG: hypothetical protein EXR67_00065 [Dehalococcoidia bacterium]|nr:hypothetical protein [Dehalococcoidia bacterium]